MNNETNSKITIERVRMLNDFEKVCFVIKAVASGKIHSFRTVVHAEPTRRGTRLVATDGKRLHTALLSTKIPKGNYVPKQKSGEVTLEKCEDEITYPSWKNIIPDCKKPKGEVSLAGAKKGKTVSGAEKLSVANSILATKTGRTVNFKFLSDLPEKIWNIYAETPKTKPIMFRDVTAEDSTFAIVSPIAA